MSVIKSLDLFLTLSFYYGLVLSGDGSGGRKRDVWGTGPRGPQTSKPDPPEPSNPGDSGPNLPQCPKNDEIIFKTQGDNGYYGSNITCPDQNTDWIDVKDEYRLYINTKISLPRGIIMEYCAFVQKPQNNKYQCKASLQLWRPSSTSSSSYKLVLSTGENELDGIDCETVVDKNNKVIQTMAGDVFGWIMNKNCIISARDYSGDSLSSSSGVYYKDLTQKNIEDKLNTDHEIFIYDPYMKQKNKDFSILVKMSYLGNIPYSPPIIPGAVTVKSTQTYGSKQSTITTLLWTTDNESAYKHQDNKLYIIAGSVAGSVVIIIIIIIACCFGCRRLKKKKENDNNPVPREILNHQNSYVSQHINTPLTKGNNPLTQRTISADTTQTCLPEDDISAGYTPLDASQAAYDATGLARQYTQLSGSTSCSEDNNVHHDYADLEAMANGSARTSYNSLSNYIEKNLVNTNPSGNTPVSSVHKSNLRRTNSKDSHGYLVLQSDGATASNTNSENNDIPPVGFRKTSNSIALPHNRPLPARPNHDIRPTKSFSPGRSVSVVEGSPRRDFAAASTTSLKPNEQSVNIQNSKAKKETQERTFLPGVKSKTEPMKKQTSGKK